MPAFKPPIDQEWQPLAPPSDRPFRPEEGLFVSWRASPNDLARPSLGSQGFRVVAGNSPHGLPLVARVAISGREQPSQFANPALRSLPAPSPTLSLLREEVFHALHGMGHAGSILSKSLVLRTMCSRKWSCNADVHVHQRAGALIRVRSFRCRRACLASTSCWWAGTRRSSRR